MRFGYHCSNTAPVKGDMKYMLYFPNMITIAYDSDHQCCFGAYFKEAKWFVLK